MVPGHAPLREGGGAAMNGMSMHGKRQVAGAATGGVLRAAVATTSTSLQQQADQTICESIMCKHASTAHRSTPPTALSIHSQGTILAPFLPSGGTPLSEGGGCLRTSHSAHATPRSHHHHHLPLKSLKNLFSILTWPYLFLNRSRRSHRTRFLLNVAGHIIRPPPTPLPQSPTCAQAPRNAAAFCLVRPPGRNISGSRSDHDKEHEMVCRFCRSRA